MICFPAGLSFAGPLPACLFAALFFAATILAPLVLFAIFLFLFLNEGDGSSPRPITGLVIWIDVTKDSYESG